MPRNLQVYSSLILWFNKIVIKLAESLKITYILSLLSICEYITADNLRNIFLNAKITVFSDVTSLNLKDAWMWRQQVAPIFWHTYFLGKNKVLHPEDFIYQCLGNLRFHKTITFHPVKFHSRRWQTLERTTHFRRAFTSVSIMLANRPCPRPV